MKKSWYYRFLRVVVLLVVSVNLQAQSNDFLQNSDLKRKGFKLAIDTQNETESMVVLEKEQLRTMLSDKQFRSYKTARNCYIASIPVFAYGAYCMLGAAASLAFNTRKYDSIILFAVSLSSFISGVTLIVYSAAQLNSIAKSYNKQRHSSHFQNGLQVNFGLVDNGIGVKLRF